MNRVIDIINIIEKLAPPSLAEPWDNVGLMVGDLNNEVNKILFALDSSEAVIDEAINLGADMIITHHPFIFKGVKSVTNNTPLGKKIYKAIKSDISIYSAHTNFDIAEGGTNSVLSSLIGLKEIEPLIEVSDGNFIGKCGRVDKIEFNKFIEDFKRKIGANYLVVNGNLNSKISKIALCTGKAASADYIYAAKSKGCDLYITGDIVYHDAQVAEDLGICLIDGTHYLTEVIAIPKLCYYVKNNFNDIECVCSKINGQTLNIV